MDISSARMFLESLLQRIVVDPETGVSSLPGVLSAYELDALRKALELLGENPISNEANGSVKQSEGQECAHDLEQKRVKQVKVELNLTSLKNETLEDENTLMCLDFGTAMSKAFATISKDDMVITNLPLKIGKRVSKTGLVYPVHSSIWIDNDGFVFVGEKAIALSEQDFSSGRQRFDSIKKALIQGLVEGSPDKVPVDPGVNPTDVQFSKGDAITFFLAFLTDLACTELEEEHKLSPYVKRRFALPSWDEERKKWGEKMLAETLAKAQILADTFHDRWDDGIRIEEIRSALDQLKELPKLPTYLIGQGVTEPLAAGTSRLRKEESTRGLVMVVDVGAGTSDFALFVVTEDPDRDIFRAWPILNCNKSLHQAGDILDTALQQAILERSRVDSSHPDFSYLLPQLRMRLRGFKEELFRDKMCNYFLSNGDRGTIHLDEFLERSSVQNFSTQLINTFKDVLDHASISFFKRFQGSPITVVLTGGGASLPMVEQLASGSCNVHGISFSKSQAPLVPDEFTNDKEISYVYPQLAVAIGGAQPTLIDERQPLNEMPGMTNQGWSVGRFQVSGT